MRIRDVIAETEVGVVGMLALKTEGGHEPRSVGSFWKLKRLLEAEKETDSSLEPPEGRYFSTLTP